MNAERRKSNVALLSVLSNATLVVLKLIIGLAIGSVSVISEAIHSGVDLLAALIAFFAVRTSSKPADDDHPFGHGKIENISGTVEAILIFFAAGWIVFEAVKKLTHSEPLEATGLGVLVMLISATMNLIVSHMLFKVGRETDSVALQADGWHLRTDVYTSAGVMGGLALIALGRKLLPGLNLQWMDPVAAILVALLIVRAAYHLTVEAARDLMDISLPPEEQDAIRQCIQSSHHPVLGFHNLRTRKAGSDRFAEFHLLVDSEMTVEESHEIADLVTDDICSQLPGCLVTIHIEPCDGKCTEKCSSPCLTDEEERRAVLQQRRLIARIAEPNN